MNKMLRNGFGGFCLFILFVCSLVLGACFYLFLGFVLLFVSIYNINVLETILIWGRETVESGSK